MWKRIIAAALLLAMLGLAGCSTENEPAPSAPTASPVPTASPAQTETVEEDGPVGVMSHFAAQDLDGNAVDADAAFGGYKLTMVNVWGTFCGPCIAEMPDLGELAGELEEKNVRIVGLVTDAMTYNGEIDAGIVETAKEIVDETGADYLHILPSADLLGLLYQISAVPTTFFVDEYGCQVGSTYAGSKDKETWAAIVEETLALLEG